MEREPSGFPFLEINNILTKLKCLQLGKKRRSHFFDKLKYVEAWAHKLLQNQYCSGLVFIDCMSNSGEYVDDDGKQVFGTPVRVAK